MAGTVKDMSLIKQVLLLKQLGESNRGISRKLSINKETVNNYIKTFQLNNWTYDDLLAKEDPELDHLFHAGNPAYSNPRMDDFLTRLPYFKEQLGNPKLHNTSARIRVAMANRSFISICSRIWLPRKSGQPCLQTPTIPERSSWWTLLVIS